MTIAFEAMKFAREAHKDQLRKYTGEPYFAHLAEVAGLVATVTSEMYGVEPAVAIAVAYLHDTIEDQQIGFGDLVNHFTHGVAEGVARLTSPPLEFGNRAARKAEDIIQLKAAPAWVQTIKVADLISNTASIVRHDPQFARLYLEEKRALLDGALLNADPRLVAIARSQIT